MIRGPPLRLHSTHAGGMPLTQDVGLHKHPLGFLKGMCQPRSQSRTAREDPRAFARLRSNMWVPLSPSCSTSAFPVLTDNWKAQLPPLSPRPRKQEGPGQDKRPGEGCSGRGVTEEIVKQPTKQNPHQIKTASGRNHQICSQILVRSRWTSTSRGASS